MAVTGASAAGYGRLAGSGASAATVFASFMAADVDGCICSENCFFEFEIEIFAKIGAALGAGATALLAVAASSSAEIEAEEISEDVVKIVEDGFFETASAGGDAGVAEAVVGGAFVGVSED